MEWIRYNPHPTKRQIGDCVIRALTKALDKSWEDVYLELSIEGYVKCDLPNADAVWGKYLLKNGFSRHLIPDDGFGDYTVEDFCKDHPKGTYVLGTGSHAICVKNGNLYDVWNSSQETIIHYFERKDN